MPEHNHNHHKYAHLMDTEKREKFLPSQEILTRLGLKSGQSLADLGCGYGHFALRAAAMVGPEGHIKAIDIEPERMKILKQRADEQNISQQIEPIMATGENIPLGDEDVETALIANVLHELEDPLSYLKDTLRILKPGGEVWVIEWVNKEMEIGPHISERRSTEEWAAILEEAGFNNVWMQNFSHTHVLLEASKPRKLNN